MGFTTDFMVGRCSGFFPFLVTISSLVFLSSIFSSSVVVFGVGLGVGVGVCVGVVINPSFRCSRATSASMSSSSFGCSCRISMFRLSSSFFSVVVDVGRMVNGVGFGVAWVVSSEFFTNSLSSLLLLSV